MQCQYNAQGQYDCGVTEHFSTHAPRVKKPSMESCKYTTQSELVCKKDHVVEHFRGQCCSKCWFGCKNCSRSC